MTAQLKGEGVERFSRAEEGREEKGRVSSRAEEQGKVGALQKGATPCRLFSSRMKGVTCRFEVVESLLEL